MAEVLENNYGFDIDDGSTDDSLRIIMEYKDRDNRIRIVTENNAGPSVARNKGLVRARGEFIIFLDADDFYEKELLETLYSLAVEKELDIAVASFDIYNNSTQYKDSIILFNNRVPVIN